MTSPCVADALHIRLADTLRAMFNCVECPIHFVSELDARGKYYFRQKAIKVNINQPFVQIIETICHELVHFKQQKYGKLSCMGKNHYVYENRNYIDTPYHEQPWEREANHYMRLMFDKFAKTADVKLIKEILDIDSRRN